MALPMATTNATPQNPAFLNMVSLFLSSPVQTTSSSAAGAQAPATTASPAELADSMIRSMLGGLSSGSTSPASADLASPASPCTDRQFIDPVDVGKPVLGIDSCCTRGSRERAASCAAIDGIAGTDRRFADPNDVGQLAEWSNGSIAYGCAENGRPRCIRRGCAEAVAKRGRSAGADGNGRTGGCPHGIRAGGRIAKFSRGERIQFEYDSSAGTPQLSVPAPSASLLAKERDRIYRHPDADEEGERDGESRLSRPANNRRGSGDPVEHLSSSLFSN